MNKNLTIIDKDYTQWVESLSVRYHQSQIRASVKVNQELLKFYWELGRDIEEMHVEERWGEKVIRNLSVDLQCINPNVKGLSRTNIYYAKKFYLLYKQYFTIVPQAVGQLEKENVSNWEKLRKDYSLSLTKGQFISFKCHLSSGSFGTIKITGGKCYLRGNCLSLIHGDKKDLSIHNHAFNALFENSNSIIGIEASFLQATTLAKYCYAYMFSGCTSLTTAPELPAITLESDCYAFMFSGCTSLTTAPELPATTLADYCYSHMFYHCSKLNYIKMLATDISASSCLNYWVSGVSNTGTFVKNKNATWSVTGRSGIPSGWTVYNDGEESGGGKPINIIQLYPYIKKGSLSVDYELSDIPTSTITIDIETTGFSGFGCVLIQSGMQAGSNIDMDLGCSTSDIKVTGYDPMEDDNFVYKVEVI